MTIMQRCHYCKAQIDSSGRVWHEQHCPLAPSRDTEYVPPVGHRELGGQADFDVATFNVKNGLQLTPEFRDALREIVIEAMEEFYGRRRR